MADQASSFPQLDLKHVDQVRGSNIVNIGIDLSEFYLSVEWDILEVPATRNEEYYLPQVSALRIQQGEVVAHKTQNDIMCLSYKDE